MGFASGAWFLLGGAATEDVEIRRRLARAAAHAGFGLHDVQRNGEKGFRRIAKGFCTTPDSRAMAQFFVDKGDEAMAGRFRFSSMEWAEARNPGVKLLVTEIPQFALAGGYRGDGQVDAPPGQHDESAPEPGETPYEKFRDELRDVVARGDFSAAVELGFQYGIKPVPFEAQCRLMLKAIGVVSEAQ
jgi:hypothetical protein